MALFEQVGAFFDYFPDVKMRLFQVLALPIAYAASYHGNAGVLQYVNPRIGTYGVTPNGNGGMSMYDVQRAGKIHD